MLFLLLLFYSITSFAQGVQFEIDKTWDKVLLMAKDSGKLVFVDVYTDWCGPCKQMDREVFPNKNVGDKMNTGFVSYKLNAEKGEGPELSRKYNVFSYPTYLFIDGNGTMIYRANGSMPIQDFLQQLNYALYEQKEPLTLLQMDSLFQTHQKDTAFLYKYIQRRTTLRQDNADLLDTYCNLLDSGQQVALPTLQLIADNGAFMVRSLQIGKALSLLVHNQQKFSSLKNIENLDNYISLAQEKSLAKAIKLKDEKLLGEILVWNQKRQHEIYDDDCDDMLKIQYYYATHQKKKYMDLVSSYMDQKLMTIPDSTLQRKDSATLAEVQKSMQARLSQQSDAGKEKELSHYKHLQTLYLIWTINKNSKQLLTVPPDKELLKKSSAWIIRAISYEEKDTVFFKNVYPFSLNIYATYLYRLRNRSKAIIYQTKALRLISVDGIANSEEEINTFKQELDEMKRGTL